MPNLFKLQNCLYFNGLLQISAHSFHVTIEHITPPQSFPVSSKFELSQSESWAQRSNFFTLHRQLVNTFSWFYVLKQHMLGTKKITAHFLQYTIMVSGLSLHNVLFVSKSTVSFWTTVRGRRYEPVIVSTQRLYESWWSPFLSTYHWKHSSKVHLYHAIYPTGKHTEMVSLHRLHLCVYIANICTYTHRIVF